MIFPWARNSQFDVEMPPRPATRVQPTSSYSQSSLPSQLLPRRTSRKRNSIRETFCIEWMSSMKPAPPQWAEYRLWGFGVRVQIGINEESNLFGSGERRAVSVGLSAMELSGSLWESPPLLTGRMFRISRRFFLLGGRTPQ